MARSGDFITPRLDGAAWFEKPPLLYWMTALGHRAGLPDEWAARLPVALVSLAFLLFFYSTVEREFSTSVATAATAILATSAGWAAFSFVAVPDLPMSAALGAAVLIALFDTHPGRGWVAGGLLGLAILAKGFVPVVLIAPVFLIARRKRLAILTGAAIVAGPWILMCYLKNSAEFWNDFFWKQHIERFFRPTLEHVQPVWFYLPILAFLALPWTPLILLTARSKTFEDVRVRTLLWYLLFGFVFFSLSRNKLPGYLLPLMPALAIILAHALNRLPGMSGAEESRAPAWWITACTLPLVAIPTVARMLPDALLSGITKVSFSLGLALPFLMASGVVFAMGWIYRPQLAMLLAALTVAVGIGYLKTIVLPALDQRTSVRVFWNSNQPGASNACLEGVRRDWEYGLNYYAQHRLPPCSATAPYKIDVQNGRLHLDAR